MLSQLYIEPCQTLIDATQGSAYRLRVYLDAFSTSASDLSATPGIQL